MLGLLHIHLKWLGLDGFHVIEADSDVKSIKNDISFTSLLYVGLMRHARQQEFSLTYARNTTCHALPAHREARESNERKMSTQDS